MHGKRSGREDFNNSLYLFQAQVNSARIAFGNIDTDGDMAC
jgi:hypothetical protein